MTGRPIWYELMTPDPGAIAPFYRATLGWEIPDDGMTTPNGQDYRVIGRADGGNAGGVLKLTDAMRSGGARVGWLPYFHVADVPSAVQRAEAAGGTTWIGPMTLPQGAIAMLSDPHGAPFYVMDPIPPADQPDAKSDVFRAKAPGHAWWNEVQTSDEPGATAFYTALFGWTAENAMPMGDKGMYRFIEAEGEPIGAINPWQPAWMGIAWLPYFGVADIEAARAAAEANGGTIHSEIHEVPGGDFIFTASDPAGAPLGFVGRKGA
jgi:predicted enzyme related to lactoylglutathione lyase